MTTDNVRKSNTVSSYITNVGKTWSPRRKKKKSAIIPVLLLKPTTFAKHSDSHLSQVLNSKVLCLLERTSKQKSMQCFQMPKQYIFILHYLQIDILWSCIAFSRGCSFFISPLKVSATLVYFISILFKAYTVCCWTLLMFHKKHLQWYLQTAFDFFPDFCNYWFDKFLTFRIKLWWGSCDLTEYNNTQFVILGIPGDKFFKA